jgi:hypothetical protein
MDDPHFWPIFLPRVGFSHWSSNGHSGRLGEKQQGACASGDSEGSLAVGR